MRAGKPDAMQLALERAAVGSQPRGNERSAGGAGFGGGGALAGVDPKLRQNAAHAARPGVVAAFDGGERGRLLDLDAVERGRQPRERALDVADRSLPA